MCSARIPAGGNLYSTKSAYSFIKNDFDADGNAYILTKITSKSDSSVTYAMYAYALDGTKSEITIPSSITYNSSSVAVTPVTFAVDRTGECLYYIMSGTVSSATSYFAVKCALSGTVSNSSLLASSANTITTMTVNNGTLYWLNGTVLETSTCNGSTWATNGCTFTVGTDFTYITSSWNDENRVNVYSNKQMTLSSTYSYSLNNNDSHIVTIKDMSYYEGTLFITLNNQCFWGNYRGGIARISLSDVSGSSYAIPLSVVSGWVTDHDVEFYRPGAKTSGPDDLTAAGLSGAEKIIGLTPKKIHVSDDGLYYSNNSNYGKIFKQRNREAVLDLTDNSIDMTNVSVEFDFISLGGQSGLSNEL
jgi:hypothetical protein